MKFPPDKMLAIKKFDLTKSLRPANLRPIFLPSNARLQAGCAALRLIPVQSIPGAGIAETNVAVVLTFTARIIAGSNRDAAAKSRDFGKIISTSNHPRIIQLALKFNF